MDEPTGFNTNTYLAISTDGGSTFTSQKVSDVNHVTAFIHEFGGGYSGDYIGITAHNGVAYPSWTDNRNGQWQIYVSPVYAYAVSGSSPFCTTGNFTLNNQPSNVTWTSSYPSGLSINPATGAASAASGFSGNVTVTATLNSPSGCSVIASKDVWVGLPILTNVTNNGTPVNFSGTIANPYVVAANNIVEVDALGGTGQVNFTLTGSPFFVSGHADNGYIYEFICKYGNNNIYLSFSTGNACGGNSGDIYFCNSNCSGGFFQDIVSHGKSLSVHPNPASTSIAIQLTGSLSASSPGQLDLPCQVVLYNRFAQAVYSAQETNTNFQIPVDGLPPDIYYLNVFYGDDLLRQQILVIR